MEPGHICKTLASTSPALIGQGFVSDLFELLQKWYSRVGNLLLELPWKAVIGVGKVPEFLDDLYNLLVKAVRATGAKIASFIVRASRLVSDVWDYLRNLFDVHGRYFSSEDRGFFASAWSETLEFLRQTASFFASYGQAFLSGILGVLKSLRECIWNAAQFATTAVCLVVDNGVGHPTYRQFVTTLACGFYDIRGAASIQQLYRAFYTLLPDIMSMPHVVDRQHTLFSGFNFEGAFLWLIDVMRLVQSTAAAWFVAFSFNIERVIYKLFGEHIEDFASAVKQTSHLNSAAQYLKTIRPLVASGGALIDKTLAVADAPFELRYEFESTTKASIDKWSRRATLITQISARGNVNSADLERALANVIGVDNLGEFVKASTTLQQLVRNEVLVFGAEVSDALREEVVRNAEMVNRQFEKFRKSAFVVGASIEQLTNELETAQKLYNEAMEKYHLDMLSAQPQIDEKAREQASLVEYRRIEVRNMIVGAIERLQIMGIASDNAVFKKLQIMSEQVNDTRLYAIVALSEFREEVSRMFKNIHKVDEYEERMNEAAEKLKRKITNFQIVSRATSGVIIAALLGLMGYYGVFNSVLPIVNAIVFEAPEAPTWAAAVSNKFWKGYKWVSYYFSSSGKVDLDLHWKEMLLLLATQNGVMNATIEFWKWLLYGTKNIGLLALYSVTASVQFSISLIQGDSWNFAMKFWEHGLAQLSEITKQIERDMTQVQEDIRRVERERMNRFLDAAATLGNAAIASGMPLLQIPGMVGQGAVAVARVYNRDERARYLSANGDANVEAVERFQERRTLQIERGGLPHPQIQRRGLPQPQIQRRGLPQPQIQEPRRGLPQPQIVRK